MGAGSPFDNFLVAGANTGWCWNSVAQYANGTNPDICAYRTAAGAIALGNGTAGDHSAVVTLGSIKPAVYTVSTLPSASTLGAGAQVAISDATTFTPGTKEFQPGSCR